MSLYPLNNFEIKIYYQNEPKFNPHMNKMVPRGPKHYIFGVQFYSKNARILRFHEFLHFYAREQMISSFYLKWIEFTKSFEFCPNLVGSPRTNNLNKIHNFFRIWSNSAKILITYVY